MGTVAVNRTAGDRKPPAGGIDGPEAVMALELLAGV